MRILFLTQWFDPEPMFKGLAFAKALRERGHEVEILTGFPNYPGGKVFPGYRVRPFQREVMEGIPVVRVPLYPSHDASAIRRIANYATFALSAATIGAAAVKPADVMYVYHPPATVALPALMIHGIRRIPFVYDIQDLWPDTLGATGMVKNGFFIGLVDRWCRSVYRAASKIVVLSPGFREMLVSRGVPGEKIEVIYNWCDEGQLPKAPKNESLAKELGFSGRFNVLFAGTMGKAQGLEAVLESAGRIGGRIPEVRFVFVGGGTEVDRLQRTARERRLNNVFFLPRRPVSEIGDVLNLADVLLVHLKDDPLFRITIPSKIQAYLAVGRPILVGVRGDAADLVRAAGAGVDCRPENPGSISEAVEKLYRMPRALLDEMGDNGKRYYREKLSLSAGVPRFEEVFQAAAVN
ncbi:MAG: glycosyltransferase WbuB [Deltaproteobacteria bacterium GWC2_65_14]|nr:MAG: glycosyltransferase WbuB [Deltaproteobacteria bacterium GWC2_65_14]